MAEVRRKAADRARRYREKKRAAGFRLAWVPDHRSPDIDAQLAREADAIAGHESEREILDWIEAVADRRGWVWEE